MRAATGRGLIIDFARLCIKLVRGVHSFVNFIVAIHAAICFTAVMQVLKVTAMISMHLQYVIFGLPAEQALPLPVVKEVIFASSEGHDTRSACLFMLHLKLIVLASGHNTDFAIIIWRGDRSAILLLRNALQSVVSQGALIPLRWLRSGVVMRYIRLFRAK